MEKDPNPIPKIDLFPLATKVGQIIRRVVSFCPLEAPAYMSNHFRRPFDEMYDAPLAEPQSILD